MLWWNKRSKARVKKPKKQKNKTKKKKKNNKKKQQQQKFDHDGHNQTYQDQAKNNSGTNSATAELKIAKLRQMLVISSVSNKYFN